MNSPLSEQWLTADGADSAISPADGYRAAFLVECALSFRSVRAAFQHSEEKTFTAWYPAGDLAIDWSAPAVDVASRDAIVNAPPEGFQKPSLGLIISDEQFEIFQDELIDYLCRNYRFGVLHNKPYGLYSAPGEARESFLNRVAERAIDRLEPEIKQLLEVFERKIEQLRERYEVLGRRLVIENAEEYLAELRTMFLTSETRLASMFLSRFRLVVNLPDPREASAGDREILEALMRIEKEANARLNERYTACLGEITDCDPFEIGLQPDHIRPIHRALLWVPQLSHSARSTSD